MAETDEIPEIFNEEACFKFIEMKMRTKAQEHSISRRVKIRPVSPWKNGECRSALSRVYARKYCCEVMAR
jgi:hypothetical protein